MRLSFSINDACSSNTRRDRGGAGGQHELKAGYATSCALQSGDVKDGVVPKYFCEKYAICYMLKINTNPNRLFFGCLLLKATQPHYKFFVWIDVAEHLGLENLIAHVEERIINLEKLLNKKSTEAELKKKNR
ncbi:hypothetical protein Ahy_A06g026888 [Arachis hypogaea]|uniref:Uncharacterized protein n=1 Tax=Arachis hypogaea TaxID=3818 RepID=A0A445CM09_ARAHY|nr:hypothetical protein Ahy_A06g026888 [Arachis hypogaea]